MTIKTIAIISILLFVVFLLMHIIFSFQQHLSDDYSVHTDIDIVYTATSSQQSTKLINQLLKKNLSQGRFMIEYPNYSIDRDLINDLSKLPGNSKVLIDETELPKIPASELETSFSLITLIEPEDKVQLKSGQLYLEAYLPSTEFILNDRKHNTKDVTIGKLEKTVLDGLLLIDSDPFFLDKISNYTSVNISDLNEFPLQYEIENNNLLDTQNPSFEEGLWRSSVEDCSNHLPGEAKILMEAGINPADKSRSLILSSSNHSACTSKTFPVTLNPTKIYRLSFDYSSFSGGKVQYYYELTDTNGEKEGGGEIIQSEVGQWLNKSILINSNLKNIVSITLYFYAPSDGKSFVENMYDNVRITEIKPKYAYSTYLEHTRPKTQLNNPILSTANINGETKIIISNITNNFILVLSDPYSSFLKLYSINNNLLDMPITIIPGFRINRYSNAWLINVDKLCKQKDLCTRNEDSTYDISLIIKHSFNQFLVFGLLISGAILAGCLIFLVYDGKKRWSVRRQNHLLDLRRKK